MIIAISTHPETHCVERFGHEMPIVMLDVEDAQLKSSRQLEQEGGCCRTLAQRIKDADILLCTGIGQGAARHLRDFGVQVALVPEGTNVADALTALEAQALESGNVQPSTCQGHHEGAAHSCGCGNNEGHAAHHDSQHCACSSAKTE
jgi:predicted Fe-Mo cluster-binding NifX family protein